MSAPNTNIEKQKRRHWGPLFGIWGAMGFAAVLFVIWVIYYVVSPSPTEEGGPVMRSDQPAATAPATPAPSN